MSSADLIRLVTLAALWGASYLFMRILAPVLSPAWTAELRLVISAIGFIIILRAMGVKLDLRKHWREYTVVGALNSAIPFLLFSYAALYLPAAYSAVLNATSPFFGALFGALLLGERLTLQRVLGVAIGIIGVAMIMRLGPIPLDAHTLTAVAACLAAASCYALVGPFITRKVRQTNPLATAGASQITGALVIAPALAFANPSGPFTAFHALCLLALALACSTVAYLLCFRLLANVGAARALTVTFLSPGFGIAWGALFLGEPITVTMLIGCAVVLVGTALVLYAKR